MRRYLDCPGCLIGTLWEINDSYTRFEVVDVVDRWAIVENVSLPRRRRRILLSALKTSRAKHGYTEIGIARSSW